MSFRKQCGASDAKIEVEFILFNAKIDAVQSLLNRALSVECVALPLHVVFMGTVFPGVVVSFVVDMARVWCISA